MKQILWHYNSRPWHHQQILSCDLKYITDDIIWAKVGNSSIFITEVSITSILWGFLQKNQFFEGCSLFKFNNLELALSMASTKYGPYTGVGKMLKLNARKCWSLIPTFVGVTAEKLVEGLFAGGLNILKTFIKVRYTLSGKISSGKIFPLRKLSSPSQYFVIFHDGKFSSDVINIFYLSWKCSKCPI